MKDFKSSLASKDKTLRESLKSASSPRTPDDSHVSSVANGSANDLEYPKDLIMETPDSGAAEAPPSRMSMGSLVEYLMSGQGRKAAKKMQKEAEGSGMVQAPVAYLVTTAGAHTPPPRIATTPPEVPVHVEETLVPEVLLTMEEVVQLAVQNKDKSKEERDSETQDAMPQDKQSDKAPPSQGDTEDKDEAQPMGSDTCDDEIDSTPSAAKGGADDVPQGIPVSDKASMAFQSGGSCHIESPVPSKTPSNTISRPSSSDRAMTSSRPPSSGAAVTPKRPNSTEEVMNSSRPPSKDRAVNASRPPSGDRTINSSRPTSKDNPITSSRTSSMDKTVNSSRPSSTDRVAPSSRPPSKDRAMNSSRPPSKDRAMNSSRPPSKDRVMNSSRPPSKDRAMSSSRPPSKERATNSSRPPSKDRAMSSSRSTSRDRGMTASRPSSRERGSRSSASSRPTSRERPSLTRADKKSSILAAVEEGREAATRKSRPTSRGGEPNESSKVTVKESVQRLPKADHSMPSTSAPRPGRTRSSTDSPWSRLTSSQEKTKQNPQKNVEKLYQRLIKKHVSGTNAIATQDAEGHKSPALDDHASKYKAQSQTLDLRDESSLQPTKEESPTQDDPLLVGVPVSLNSSSSSRPHTPKQDTPSSGTITVALVPKEGHSQDTDTKQLPVHDIQPSRSLLATMAEENFLNARSHKPESISSVPKVLDQDDSNDKTGASDSHSQEIKTTTAVDKANQSTEQAGEKSGSQPGSGKQPTTDQSITENGVAGSTTSVKDSGGKVPAPVSGPSRVAVSGGGENKAAEDPGEAVSIIQGDVGTRSIIKTVGPHDPLKLLSHSDHGVIPADSIRGGGFPRAQDHPAPYVPSLRGDVLVKALEESARTNAGDRIHIPTQTGQGGMPYHMAPRGTSLSAVEVPEPTLATVSLAVSKGANEVGRPTALRDHGSTGGIFDRFTSNSSSTSLWHKITPLTVRPSNESYYREPREYEDYLPREPPRPVLQRRNSLGRINNRDYDEDYYYEDDHNESSRHMKVKESRGAQTVRVKNQQPRHSILKKTEPRPPRKEEPRNTILEKLEEYRNTPPIIIASGLVPKNLESLTSEYQATRGAHKDKDKDGGNGTRNHVSKEKEHFQDRHGETGVTAPLLASSGQKQSIGDVFDRLHNNRRLEHAALVSRKPELKQKPKPIPAKSKEKDAGITSVTPRGVAAEPPRHHSLQNGGKDVYTRLYQNTAPPRKRRDEYGEATRLLDNAAPIAAPALAFRQESHKTSPRASKDVQKQQTRADHIINMPMLAPDIVVDDIGEPAPVHPGRVEQAGKGGNDKIPIVLLQGFFQGPGARSPHHRRPSMSVNELTLPPHLVDVTSVIRGALPVLPRSLAALCLTLNILLPGLGTAASGWLGLCWGRNRMGTVETSGHRFTSVVVTAATGLVQLFTVTFFLVGWFWGVAWGILLVSIANKYTQFVSEHRSSISGAVSLEMLAVNAS